MKAGRKTLLVLMTALASFGLAAFIVSFATPLKAPAGTAPIAAVEQALIETAGRYGVPVPPPLDLSPAVLDTRTKTAECVASGGLPDHACTPGAIFASTTLQTICQSGYTKTVRNVPVSLKKKIYAAYGIPYPQTTGSYEADHLIPLELGGSNDIANLFPEAAAPAPGFREKDLVENYLHNESCAGRMSLSRAQENIARDWLSVYRALTPAQIEFLKNQYKRWAPN